MLHLFVQIFGTEQAKEIEVDKYSTVISILENLKDEQAFQNLSSIQFFYQGHKLGKYLSFAFQNIENNSKLIIYSNKKRHLPKFMSISEKYRKKFMEESQNIDLLFQERDKLTDFQFIRQDT